MHEKEFTLIVEYDVLMFECYVFRVAEARADFGYRIECGSI